MCTRLKVTKSYVKIDFIAEQCMCKTSVYFYPGIKLKKSKFSLTHKYTICSVEDVMAKAVLVGSSHSC